MSWKDELQRLLAACESLSRKAMDDTGRKNMEAASAAGLETRVIRSYDDVGLHGGKDVCEFCKSREGDWSYKDAIRHGVFQRHPGCECEIDYATEKGVQRQVDWRANRWEYVPDRDTMTMRKRYGAKGQMIDPRERVVRAEFQLSAISGESSEGTIRHELGEIDISKAKDAIEYFSNAIRGDTVENAIIIDKNGKVVHFVGTPDGVGLFDVELDGAHILHNHPEINGIVSFGEDDFFVYRENQSAIYDLCNKEYDYHLEIIKDISGLTYTEITHWVTDNLIELNEPEEDFQHLVMEALKDRGYVKYERRRKN